MLIIKCFDIVESLFLSRLALELKIYDAVSLQALKKPGDLCSSVHCPEACGDGSEWATLLTVGASKDN
jgi:hypothetical protein